MYEDFGLFSNMLTINENVTEDRTLMVYFIGQDTHSEAEHQRVFLRQKYPKCGSLRACGRFYLPTVSSHPPPRYDMS